MVSWQGIRSAFMAVAGLAGLAAIALIVVESDGVLLPVEQVDPAEALRARVTVLRHQAVMAREGRQLLVLDPSDSTLTLYLGGVELKAWRVHGVAAGSRRLVLRGEVVDGDWRTRLWQNPRLDPPVERERRVIVSDSVEPPDPSGAVDWIPPLPEEEVPNPSRFVAHYTGGLGLEVVAEGRDTVAVARTFVDEVGAGLRHLHPRNLDRHRIRVRMTREDAGALYRSFPDDAALVVNLPNRPPAAPGS